jgi:DNA-binding NarL/FixJ family response regulator
VPGPTRDDVLEDRAARPRVLLVHGDAHARHALASTLATEGMTVDEARSARDAEAIAGYAPPDVVVYGLGWGSRLRQLDALSAAVEQRPAVVLLTPAWVRARRGVTLRGRVGSAELVSAVGRALRERRARARR